MFLKQHYSGSTSNLYTVTAANGNRLLIDPGCLWKDLLKAINYDLNNIEGCLLTHEHEDHSKAVLDVIDAGIDVYASFETLRALGVCDKRKAHVIYKKLWEDIGCFEVLAWDAIHNTPKPLFFVVKCDGEYLLFATDTSHIVQQFWFPFSTIAIECSYDKEILENRMYLSKENLKEEGLTRVNETLAKRLLKSHMEKQTLIKYLEDYCDLSKCRQIHLLHMSRDNIEAEQTRKEIEERFFIETIIV